jgi:hypothetical protein
VEAVEFRQGWSVSARRGRQKEEKKATKEGGLSPQEGDVRKKKRRQPRKVVCCHKKGTLRRFKNRKRPRKARRWLREGKVPVSSTKKFLFLVHEYLGSERPVSFEVLAPTRLCLRCRHVRRKFRQRTTLRSESSTLKGLLYAPSKREQYHKDYSMQVEDPAANVARNVALSPWSVVWVRKLSYGKQQSTFLFTSLGSSGDSLLGLYCVAWLTQESVSLRIFVKRNEKPTRSVQGTWGRRYEVFTLRN